MELFFTYLKPENPFLSYDLEKKSYLEKRTQKAMRVNFQYIKVCGLNEPPVLLPTLPMGIVWVLN